MYIRSRAVSYHTPETNNGNLKGSSHGVFLSEKLKVKCKDLKIVFLFSGLLLYKTRIS